MQKQHYDDESANSSGDDSVEDDYIGAPDDLPPESDEDGESVEYSAECEEETASDYTDEDIEGNVGEREASAYLKETLLHWKVYADHPLLLEEGFCYNGEEPKQELVSVDGEQLSPKIMDEVVVLPTLLAYFMMRKELANYTFPNKDLSDAQIHALQVPLIIDLELEFSTQAFDKDKRLICDKDGESKVIMDSFQTTIRFQLPVRRNKIIVDKLPTADALLEMLLKALKDITREEEEEVSTGEGVSVDEEEIGVEENGSPQTPVVGEKVTVEPNVEEQKNEPSSGSSSLLKYALAGSALVAISYISANQIYKLYTSTALERNTAILYACSALLLGSTLAFWHYSREDAQLARN